jgi:hypothetical protein
LDALVRGAALDEAVLLGCQLLPATLQRAHASGALVFPVIPSLPFHPYRSALYTTDELFAGFGTLRRPVLLLRRVRGFEHVSWTFRTRDSDGSAHRTHPARSASVGASRAARSAG